MDRDPRVSQCNLFWTKTELREKNQEAKEIIEADTKLERSQADAS